MRLFAGSFIGQLSILRQGHIPESTPNRSINDDSRNDRG